MSDETFIFASLAALRLRWQIREGAIWQDIRVLDDPCDPDSEQRPFQDESGELHEIAGEFLSEDGDMESFTVNISSFTEEWEARQLEQGHELPKLKFQLEKGQKRFTLGDYVLRVHPWLLSLRGEILRNQLPSSGGSSKLDADQEAELWVDPTCQCPVSVCSPIVVDMDELWDEAAERAQDLKRQLDDEAARANEEDEWKRRLSCLDFLRLRWEVRQGPMQERIRVLKDVDDPDSEQEPFLTESGVFHEIADLPLTMTPLSELRVSLAMERQEPKDSSSEQSRSDAADVEASNLEAPAAEITIVPGHGRDVISIKDFVLAAHDWLVSWRPVVLQRNGQHCNSSRIITPWPDETQLWLNPLQVDMVDFFQDQTQSLRMQWNMVSITGPADRRPQDEDKDEDYEYMPVYPTELLPDSHFAESPNICPSLAFLRLRWTIPAPEAGDFSVAESISVLEDVFDPKSAQRPFQDESGELHEIASLPFSRPPRQTLEVAIDRLDGRHSWKLWTGETPDSPRIEDPDSAPKLSVRPSVGCDFISIGDYVAQAHPWLVSLRPQLIKELGLTDGYTEYEEDTQLWIDPTSPELIEFYTDMDGQEALEGEWTFPASIASKG